MATRTISNAGGAWNNTATWGGSAVPTNADDVVATATSGNVSITVSAVCRSLDLTNYVGTITKGANLTVGGTANSKVFFVSGFTWVDNSGIFVLSGTTVGGTFESAGKTIRTLQCTPTANTASWILQSNTTVSGNISVTRGIFDANNKNVTTGSITSTGALVRTVTLGSGIWTITTTTGLSLIILSGSNLTWNQNTSTVVINANTTTNNLLGVREILMLGKSFYNLTINGNIYQPSAYLGTDVTVQNNLVINGPCIVSVEGIAVQAMLHVLGTITMNTSVGNPVYLVSQAPGSAWLISGNGSNQTFDYLIVADCDASTDGAVWTANNSQDGGDNTGWTINNPASIGVKKINGLPRSGVKSKNGVL